MNNDLLIGFKILAVFVLFILAMAYSSLLLILQLMFIVYIIYKNRYKYELLKKTLIKILKGDL